MSASISNEELLAAVDAMHGCGNASLENWQDKLDFGYEEFLEQFNQAKFDGKKTEAELESYLDEWLGAKDIPLCPEKQEQLIDFISGIAINGSSSWVSAHAAMKYCFAFTNEVSDERLEQLDMADFANYVDELIGHGVTGFQYITAAVEWCKRSIKETLTDPTEEKKAEFFEYGYYAYSYIGGWEFGQDAVAFVQRNPEWRNALWLHYFENEDFVADSYEPLLMDTAFVEEFQEELKQNANVIYKRWCDDGEEDLYSGYGPLITEIFVQSGLVTDGGASIKRREEQAAQQAQWAKDNEEREAIERVERIKRNEKVREEMANRSDEDIFLDALNDCMIEKIFEEAERFKQLITDNIADIASNYTEENEYFPTGNEPQWLIDALKKADACIEGIDSTDCLATLVQRGLDGLEGDTWLSGHQNVAASFFLAEAWDSNMEARLSDFAQYVHEREVSEDEYLDAGKPVVAKYVADMLNEQNMKACFQWAWDTFSQEADNPFTSLSLAYIKRHPEHRDALWEMLFDGDAGSENWEELLSSQWFDEFKDKIELSAKTINDEWRQGGDFSDFGAEVAEVFKRGLELSTTPATIDFTGKRVCVTGKLSQTRKEVEALLEAAGATIASGVSKTTDFLIAGEDAGSKLAKAQEHSAPVLTEVQMMAALGHNK